MRQVHSIHVLGRLALDLINGVESEWRFELRQGFTEAGDEAFGFGAEADDLEIVRQALEHLDGLLFAVVLLGFVKIPQDAVQVEHKNGQFGALGRECFPGDEQSC